MLLRSPSRLLLLAAEIAVLTGFAVAGRAHRGALIDDAYISCRYAARWAEGHGLTMNDGERVEGFSNPLWTLTLGLLARAGIAPHRAAPVLGLACLLLLPPLCVALARGRGLHGAARALLVLGVALDVGLWTWAGSGLETVSVPLFVVAWLVMAAGVSRERGGWGRGLALGAIASGLALSRPEGFLFVAWGAAWLIWLAWARGTLLGGFLTGLLPAALYLAVRWTLWGRLVPNTFFAKLELSARALPHGGSEVGLWMAAHAALVALVVFGTNARRDGRWSLLAAGWLALLGLFVIAAGGGWMGKTRYLAPAVPLLALVAAESWRDRRRSARWIAPALALHVGLGIALRDRIPTYTREGARLGAWLAEVAEPGDRVAVTAAGAIPYFSKLPTLDVLGITDGEVRTHPARHAGEWAPGHHRYDLDRVLAEAPRWIVWDFGVPVNEARLRRPAGPERAFDFRAALLARPDFRAAYRIEHAAPRDTQPVYTVFRRAGS